MKKLILVLAIALIASPAFALNVTLVQEGTSDVIDVVYTGADAANPPRAFALDITVVGSVGPTIDSVTNYGQGESTSVNPRYGIYPARIDVNSGGVVANWGTPLADGADPGAGTGTTTSHIVLEFASLYYGDVNAPVTTGNTSGTLAKLNLNRHSYVPAFDLRIQAETTYRGGIVLEDGTQFATDHTITIAGAGGPPPKAVIGLPASPGTKVSVTQDLTWTAGSGGTPATSRDVFFGTVNPPVTKVIADGTVLTYDTGTMALNKTYYWRVDEKNSFGTTTGDVWNFKSECFPNPGSAKYIEWGVVGKPDCWCALVQPRQCHGDADGKSEGKTNPPWVFTNDLNIMVSAWNKPYATIANSTYTGNGVTTPLICADFTHLAEGKTNPPRVFTLDLNILVANWNKPNLPAADCSVSGY